MGHSNYLVRCPASVQEAALQGGKRASRTAIHLVLDATDEAGLTEIVTLEIWKGSDAHARVFSDPAVDEAVRLCHDLPSSFYEGMHELDVEHRKEQMVRYSTPDEVVDLSNRLRRVTALDTLVEYANRQDLREVIRRAMWLQMIIDFFEVAARLRQGAFVHHEP